MKAIKNSRKNYIGYVSQMYSPGVTTRRNEAMEARKQLRSEDKQIQTFDKNPAILLVKKTRGDNTEHYVKQVPIIGKPVHCTAKQWTVLYMIGA